MNDAAEAISAARKALAEGEEIIRQARQTYGIKVGRSMPLSRAWERGDFRRVSAKLQPDAVEYWLGQWEYDAINAVRTMLNLAASTKKPGLRAICYREAGHQLNRLRYRSGHRNAVHRDTFEWREIIKIELKIGLTRAYELLRLAKGRETVDERRAEEANRKRAQRGKKRAESDVPESTLQP